MTPFTKKIIHRKTEGFGNILWELLLDAIDSKIKSLKEFENPPHQNFIEGLSQIITALDTFLDTTSLDPESTEDFCIKVYNSVHLENSEILRTTGKFQGKAWFSDIMVTPAEDQGHYRSDEGAWYGKVGKILKVIKYFSLFSSIIFSNTFLRCFYYFTSSVNHSKNRTN